MIEAVHDAAPATDLFGIARTDTAKENTLPTITPSLQSPPLSIRAITDEYLQAAEKNDEPLSVVLP